MIHENKDINLYNTFKKLMSTERYNYISGFNTKKFDNLFLLKSFM